MLLDAHSGSFSTVHLASKSCGNYLACLFIPLLPEVNL